MNNMAGNRLRAALAGAAALALTGCVSFGAEPPESLLTLDSTAQVAVGPIASASAENSARTIAVLPIDTPAKLDVTRVPVMVSDTELAYLQDAFWVEKPARLFRRLLGDTLRAGGGTLVLDNDDTPLLAAQTLRGTLREMGYDAANSQVVVRYDAVRTSLDGTVTSRRFEAREDGVLPEAASVGPALNRAANSVAADVAAWMNGAG